VPHNYPLHVDIDAECQCCRMLQPFRFSSPTDHVVCTFCSRHLGGDKAAKRDTDHLAMWFERHSEAIAAHRSFVAAATAEKTSADAANAELRAQLNDLTKSIADEFDRSPLGGARGLVENEVTRRAERRTELAHRLNDRIMAALWRVDTLHRDDEANNLRCTCGKPTAECAEWKAIEPQRRALYDWENRNLALLKEGKRHGLPDDHPEVVKGR
jgi:hypothetical protein